MKGQQTLHTHHIWSTSCFWRKITHGCTYFEGCTDIVCVWCSGFTEEKHNNNKNKSDIVLQGKCLDRPTVGKMEVSATLSKKQRVNMMMLSFQGLILITFNLNEKQTDMNTLKHWLTYSLGSACWTKWVRLWILYCTWTWKIHYDELFSNEYEVLPCFCFILLSCDEGGGLLFVYQPDVFVICFLSMFHAMFY